VYMRTKGDKQLIQGISGGYLPEAPAIHYYEDCFFLCHAAKITLFESKSFDYKSRQPLFNFIRL
jgi:hypothetical protein